MSLVPSDPRTALERSRAWANLPDDELKRRATVAANERDGEALWSLVDAYLGLYGERGTRVSRYTLRNYRRGILDLIEAWPGENVLRPRRDAPRLWIETLNARGLKPGTIRLKIAAARTLYKALRWAGATQAVPFADVRAPRDPQSPWEKRQAYSREQLHRLLTHADPHETALVLLGAHAGLRIGEVAALRWEDVDLLGRQLRILGKGGKEARVPMSRSLVEALADLPYTSEEAKVVPWKVDYLRERFRQLCTRAGVPYRGRAYHGLRHSAGTHMLEDVGDVFEVADVMRHANIETTRTYAKRTHKKVLSVLERW